MTQTTDLEQRLRAFTVIMTLGGNFDTARDVMFEAADELARLRERLQNAVYALELWEREALIAGKRPSWAILPLECGSREMMAARTALKGSSHE